MKMVILPKLRYKCNSYQNPNSMFLENEKADNKVCIKKNTSDPEQPVPLGQKKRKKKINELALPA